MSAARAQQEGLTGRLAKWAQRLSAKDAESSEQEVSDREASKPKLSREIERRKILYNDIGSFLFAHDLDLTPLNFGLAHDYLTGNDLAIEKAVSAILRERGKLSNGKVETILSETRSDEITPDALADVLNTVEENLSELTKLVDVSRSEASEYGAELQAQVQHLADPQKADPVLAKLIAITRSMVDKTRRVESQMRESQKQTRLLQKNLESARKAAEQDHLTGLPNRRAFETTLKEMTTAAREKGELLSIAFCDIDHFKNFNDTYGHDVGDRVLKFVAGLLSKISGETCHVARHGGEEFVMLFRGKSQAEACEIVDEARQDMSQRNLVNRNNGERMEQVTFSAGVANVLAYEDERAAMKAADRALYLAKEHGRNRVYMAADAD